MLDPPPPEESHAADPAPATADPHVDALAVGPPVLAVDHALERTLNAVIAELGVRFVALEGNDLIFEIQRRSDVLTARDEVADTARQLLMDSQEPTVRALLSEGANRQMRLLFY